MKVKVNIINIRCILETEAVTVSNVIAIASLFAEIWLATERQTDRQTDTHARTSTLKLGKSLKRKRNTFSIPN